jgi:hypothetical protein
MNIRYSPRTNAVVSPILLQEKSLKPPIQYLFLWTEILKTIIYFNSLFIDGSVQNTEE